MQIKWQQTVYEALTRFYFISEINTSSFLVIIYDQFMRICDQYHCSQPIPPRLTISVYASPASEVSTFWSSPKCFLQGRQWIREGTPTRRLLVTHEQGVGDTCSSSAPLFHITWKRLLHIGSDFSNRCKGQLPTVMSGLLTHLLSPTFPFPPQLRSHSLRNTSSAM